jgi:twitching motility two-component system response regulator PilH
MAKVLIVDDSPTEVHVLSGFLKKHGFEVETAADGGEGIEKARAVKPDLILMDVVMPGMNGFQATRELARNPETASIPVIMVTTKGLETDKIWGMRQGAKDYLVKPVTEAVLVEKVRGALEGHD